MICHGYQNGFFFIFGLLFPTDPLGLCQNGLKFKVCEWVSGFKGS